MDNQSIFPFKSHNQVFLKLNSNEDSLVRAVNHSCVLKCGLQECLTFHFSSRISDWGASSDQSFIVNFIAYKL